MPPNNTNPDVPTEAILIERARLLAIPVSDNSEPRDERECITFRIKQETYAVDCRYVRRIARSAGIAPIPGTPPFVAGVMRIHEEIHAVFDLRALLGGQRQPITDESKIIALGEERIEFCLFADEVVGVVAIAETNIHTRDFGREHDEKSFIRGVTNDAILILDSAAMLRDQDLYVGGGATRT